MRRDLDNWTPDVWARFTGFREEGERDGQDAETGCSPESLERIRTLRTASTLGTAGTLESGEC